MVTANEDLFISLRRALAGACGVPLGCDHLASPRSPAALRGRAGLDSGGWCSGALFCAPVHGFRCISLYALHRKTATTAGLDSASSAPALCTTTLHHHMHHHMHQQAHDAGMNKSQLYLEALRAPPHAPPHAPAGAGPPSISEGALTANLPTVLGAQGDFCLVDLGDPSQDRSTKSPERKREQKKRWFLVPRPTANLPTVLGAQGDFCLVDQIRANPTKALLPPVDFLPWRHAKPGCELASASNEVEESVSRR